MPHPNISTELNPNYNPKVLDNLSAVARDELIAAIDLGSNSFHLAVARVDKGEVRKVLSLSEKVQLGAGLDENNWLSNEVIERGVACLSRFGQYLDAVPKNNIRIVATNALRKAVNRRSFIDKVNGFLPVPVEVIAGREEARLIYLGVSHTNASSDRRLVIDIGGGSTEFIIGQGFDPIEIESLQMGCVAFTKKFFDDGKITEQAFNRTMNATETELLTIAKRYKKTGWTHTMGSSGTVKACYLAITELGIGTGITQNSMKKLKDYLIKLGHINKLELDSIKPHRRGVIAAGVAQLLAIMQVLEIESMDYSDGALREGVMYDMLGRQDTEDVQVRTVQAMGERYFVSPKQASLVKETALRLFDDNRESLKVDDGDRVLLGYAADLHEIGLAISHSSYHNHTSYLLKYSDMFGFSRDEQDKMALLTLYQRRKLKPESLSEIRANGGVALVYLCLILRLSVLAHQSRSRHSAKISLTISDKKWKITLADGNHREILLHQLADEVGQFAKWGVSLTLQ